MALRARGIAGRSQALSWGCERSVRAGRAAYFAYGKSVWFWHPWLVSSWRRLFESNRVRSAANPFATEARGIRLRGERAISRQTTAQGRPDALRWTCMLVCALLCAHCTRDRGCSAHPVFPAPWSENLQMCNGRFSPTAVAELSRCAKGDRACKSRDSSGVFLNRQLKGSSRTRQGREWMMHKMIWLSSDRCCQGQGRCMHSDVTERRTFPTTASGRRSLIAGFASSGGKAVMEAAAATSVSGPRRCAAVSKCELSIQNGFAASRRLDAAKTIDRRGDDRLVRRDIQRGAKPVRSAHEEIRRW